MFDEDSFLNFVVNTAEQTGKLFMLDSGEGNDFTDDNTGWYVEDLSGWLIEPSDKERFLVATVDQTAYELFSHCYVFVECSKTSAGSLSITFKYY